MMNDLKPKIGEYMMRKCREAAGPAGAIAYPPGLIGLANCMHQMKETNGGAVKNLFASLKDYMEQSGGGKDAFCDCAF